MKDQEKIVCAAIKVYVTKEEYKGTNIVTGVNYESIGESGLLSLIAHDSHIGVFRRGFITNKNRFVDAKNAFVIAVNAGQIMPYGGNDIPNLRPEDIY